MTIRHFALTFRLSYSELKHLQEWDCYQQATKGGYTLVTFTRSVTP
jgi:hypothetical protein